jgi:hypothetical protein
VEGKEGKLVEEVAKTARRVRSLDRQTQAAREEMYALMQRAHKAGISLRTLAELTNLSPQRVHQIVTGG